MSGNISDMGDHYMATFLLYLYEGLNKICKTGHFRAKPDPGQMSGENYFTKKILMSSRLQKWGF